MSSRRNSLENITINSVPTANAGLWLEKYIADQDRNNQDQNNSRSKLVDATSKLTMADALNAYKAFFEKWQKTLQEIGARTQEASVKGRMIVGLGNEGVLETSVTLHNTYGTPYIPGSALKGLTANYARQKLDEKWDKNSEAYKVIFGDTDEAGYITFFDALYIPETGHLGQALYPDVITVHHPKYYQGTTGIAPADWDSPTPIPFLSATGKYLVALAAPELTNSQVWLDAVFDILKHALLEMGIGAKTSSGYGRLTLKDEEESVDLNDPELQAAEALIANIAAITDQNPLNQLQSRYFPKWRDLQMKRAKLIVGKAIVDRVHLARPEIRDRALKTGWYLIILDYLQKNER